MSSIAQPHDKFFFQIMSKKRHAKAFFKQYLPEVLKPEAKLSKLKILNGKMVTSRGRQLYIDILCECPLRNRQHTRLRLICEHQSTPQPYMPARLLEYVATDTLGVRNNGGCKNPITVCFVVYNGISPWNYPVCFDGEYEDLELGKMFLSMGPICLVDVTQMTPEEIHQNKELGFFFAALKSSRAKDIISAFGDYLRVPEFRNNFLALPEKTRNLVTNYLLGLVSNEERERIREWAEALSDNKQEREKYMKTIAQAIQEEGIEIGRIQGVEIGERRGERKGEKNKSIQIAKVMLFELNLPIDTVRQATGLGKKVLQELKKGLKVATS